MSKPVRALQLDEYAKRNKLLIPAENDGYNFCHVTKPTELIQASGYLKYICAQKRKKSVYFRGQAKMYSTLPPGLYRGMRINNGGVQSQRNKRFDRILSDINEKNTLHSIHSEVHEAILQHYGLKTRWLDVVDNVWVALWFACHDAVTTGRFKQYEHFEQRDVHVVGDAKSNENMHGDNKDDKKNLNPNYAYILLIESAAIPKIDSKCAGQFEDKDSRTIDLRVAAPSQFIRPHAQHGLVMQVIGKNKKPVINFATAIVGVIRINVGDALKWLGSGALLCAHSLFPPPTYDMGYKLILENISLQDDVVGSIHHIGA